MIKAEDSLPFISVIIPVYRNPSGLRVCIEALDGQTYPLSRFEVVIVDNGDLGSLLDGRANVRLVREDRPGSYAARNSGVEEARGSVFAFTDSDCIPAADWLTESVRALGADGSSGLIAGYVEVFVRNPERPNLFETHQLVKGFYQERAVRENRRGGTVNLIAYREVFEKTGLFRGDFQSGGDFEWCRRALDEGYPVGYSRDSIVLHPARFAPIDFILRYVRSTGGRKGLREAGHEPPVTIRRMLRLLVPPFRETHKYRSHPALRSGFGKLQFIAGEYLVQGIRLIETLRIQLGGTPIRY